VNRRENNVPNSVGRVVSAGAVVDLPYGFFTTLRLRHFGHVPLNESGSAYAGSTTLINFGAGYQYKDFKVEADVFNLFDSNQSDIAYYYNSCLPNEDCPGGADPGNPGLLRHPVERRMVRVTASLRF
jgi:hypothetical protein